MQPLVRNFHFSGRPSRRQLSLPSRISTTHPDDGGSRLAARQNHQSTAIAAPPPSSLTQTTTRALIHHHQQPPAPSSSSAGLGTGAEPLGRPRGGDGQPTRSSKGRDRDGLPGNCGGGGRRLGRSRSADDWHMTSGGVWRHQRQQQQQARTPQETCSRPAIGGLVDDNGGDAETEGVWRRKHQQQQQQQRHQGGLHYCRGLNLDEERRRQGARKSSATSGVSRSTAMNNNKMAAVEKQSKENRF